MMWVMVPLTIHGAVKLPYFRFPQVCGYEMISSLVRILRDSLKRNHTFVLFPEDGDHRLENYAVFLRNSSSRLITSKTLCSTRNFAWGRERRRCCCSTWPTERNDKIFIRFCCCQVFIKIVIEIDSFASWEQESKKSSMFARFLSMIFLGWYIEKLRICFCQSFDNQTGITVVTSSEILLASILASRGFFWTYLVMRAEWSLGSGGDQTVARVSKSWTFAVQKASAHLDRSERTIHSTTLERK